MSATADKFVPKRVCMIAYTEYSMDGRVRLEAESLVRWGHEVTFLTLQEDDERRDYDLEGVKVKELKVEGYGGKNKFLYVYSYLKFFVLAFFSCTSLFLKGRVDVIHVHNMPDFLVFAGLIPRLFGCKIILDVHDTVPETYMAKFDTSSKLFFSLLSFEEWISFAFSDKIICVNDVQCKAVINRGVQPEKIITIVTMPKFPPQPAETNRDDHNGNGFRLVNHGTISKRLGIDLIVEATAKVAPQIPGFEFHLFGQGDDLEYVLERVKALGLSDSVHYHGMIPWASVPTELKKMDAGIVANRRNVATELMLPAKLIDFVHLGIPAIVPRLPTIEHYFTPEMATFFEPENVDSIAAAIVTLYKNELRRKEQIEKAKSFLIRCSWENSSKGLKDLYNTI
jgi:glycosyltransferase involved in cell wall biosynthesis